MQTTDDTPQTKRDSYQDIKEKASQAGVPAKRYAQEVQERL